MLCGREVWPPGPDSCDRDHVGSGRDRAGAQADVPTSSEGSQCSASATDAVDQARIDHVERAAGHDLLGRLEDQPDPAGQAVARASSASASPVPSEDRGVHVVAAGVADARAPASGRARLWGPRAAARRGRRAARRSGRGSRRRCHTRGRCRRAGAAPGRRASAARRRPPWCACSARPSSGWACSSRRSATSFAGVQRDDTLPAGSSLTTMSRPQAPLRRSPQD